LESKNPLSTAKILDGNHRTDIAGISRRRAIALSSRQSGPREINTLSPGARSASAFV
jgi:hypothetical protein